MKLIVTKEGASLPQNTWKEGQEIKCSTPLAEMFIKNGFVIDEDAPKVDEPKVDDEPKKGESLDPKVDDEETKQPKPKTKK